MLNFRLVSECVRVGKHYNRTGKIEENSDGKAVLRKKGRCVHRSGGTGNKPMCDMI